MQLEKGLGGLTESQIHRLLKLIFCGFEDVKSRATRKVTLRSVDLLQVLRR